MAIKRDEQGNLVVDGKVVPKYTEQLYLRRGVCECSPADKAEFIAKAEPDKVQEMDQPYDAHITMAGGEVRRNDKVLKDLPEHPECMIPEKLERAEVKVDGCADATMYDLMGVNYDPGEVVEDEPIEEQK